MAGTRLAVQAYFAFFILALGLPLAVYHEYVPRGSPAPAPERLAAAFDTAERRLAALAPSGSGATAVAALAARYVVDVVVIGDDGGAVSPERVDGTLGVLGASLRDAAGVDIVIRRRRGQGAPPAGPVVPLEALQRILDAARADAAAAPWPDARARVLRLALVATAAPAAVLGGGVAVSIGAPEPGGAVLLAAGDKESGDAALAAAGGLLREIFGLAVDGGFALAPREAEALAVANAGAARRAAAGAFAELARVGPYARPTAAAAAALKAVEASAAAPDAAASAALLRSAAATIHAALDDPALALPQHMPAEHLGAVYAPIIAPLVAPLLYGLYSETRRYRRKRRAPE